MRVARNRLDLPEQLHQLRLILDRAVEKGALQATFVPTIPGATFEWSAIRVFTGHAIDAHPRRSQQALAAPGNVPHRHPDSDHSRTAPLSNPFRQWPSKYPICWTMKGNASGERSVLLTLHTGGSDPHTRQLPFHLPSALPMVCFGKLHSAIFPMQGIQLTRLSMYLPLRLAQPPLDLPIFVSTPRNAPPSLVDFVGFRPHKHGVDESGSEGA